MKNNNFEDTYNIGKKGIISQSTRENIKHYWYKFRRNKLSILGLIIVAVTIFLSIFSPYIAPYPEHIFGEVDYNNRNLPPSLNYWFGTDGVGRDVFSRVLYCFRSAILMAIVVLSISVPFGVSLGLIAGYYHGTWLDHIIMRITDIFLSIPALILALSIATIMKPSLIGSMIAITVMWWTWYARMAYGSATAISNEYFVKNAELIGASKLHILFKEILPSLLSPIFTKMAIDVGMIILVSATLSFAGLGEQAPIPAFGTMINDGYKYIPDLWWVTIFPALGIIFIILGFNLFGDGIRDMLDVRRQ